MNVMLATILLFLNNAVDFVIELALAIKYLGLEINLPLISEFIIPLLEEPTTLFFIGIFFIVSSVFWIIAFPFMK